MGPEADNGALNGVGGHDGVNIRPRFVNVLKNDGGFRDGVASVEEYWNLFVDGVVGEKRRALLSEVFLHVLELQPFQLQRQLNSVCVSAGPVSEQPQRSRRRRYGIRCCGSGGRNNGGCDARHRGSSSGGCGDLEEKGQGLCGVL